MQNLKIAAAQISIKDGDVEANIASHLNAIAAAIKKNVSVIVFPELSLTGYSLDIAGKLAFSENDFRLNPFRELSKKHKVTTVIGVPIKSSNRKPYIGAIRITNSGETDTYFKIHLHSTEVQYFSYGLEPHQFRIQDEKIGLAICADITHASHPSKYKEHGVSIYAAGVIISENGYAHETSLLQNYAKENQMLVVMANNSGLTGTIHSCGQSAIWSPNGECIVRIGKNDQALVIAEKISDCWVGEKVEI